MKITIKVEGENNKEDLVLTSEYLANDNFVDMIIGGEEYTVPIDELLVAINSFSHTRTLRIEREKGYE